MRRQTALSAIDLFAGCGGLTVGLKDAGFRVIGAVEFDSLAARTYRHNHPEVYLWEQDIRDLTPEEVLDKLGLARGQLDLLAGCPPCQGFSHLRTLNRSRRVHDERNDLIFDFLRFVTELRPMFVMMENVPGLVHDHRFKSFLKALCLAGYFPDYKLVDAADYGVPQRRRRLVLLAGRLAPISIVVPKRKRRTVFDALRALPKAGTSGDPLHDFPERRTEKVMERIRRTPKNGGSRTDLSPEDQLDCHRRCTGFKDVYGRMSWGHPAPTITTGCFNPSKGRFLHPEEDRAITLREAALLQSFPPHYHFCLDRGKTGVALMIGNALPPPIAKAHALQIRRLNRHRKQLKAKRRLKFIRRKVKFRLKITGESRLEYGL